MLAYGLRRLVGALLLAVIVASIIFVVARLLPASPVAGHEDPRVSQSQRRELERIYGLDQPLVAQYGSWLGSLLTGDLGTSWSRRQPVSSVLLQHLPVTVALGGLALLIQFGVGSALGLWAAGRPDTPLDRSIRAGALLFYAVPTFVAALLAIEIFAVRLPWFPSGQLHSPGWRSWGPAGRSLDALYHLLLPATVLGLGACGAVVRFARNGILAESSSPYITTARAAGIEEGRIRRLHTLRNAVGPMIQLLGASLPILISGSVIIEVIFSLPGLGRVTYDAVRALDYPLTVGGVLLTTTLVVLGNLVADLAHGWADPRVRATLAIRTAKDEV